MKKRFAILFLFTLWAGAYLQAQTCSCSYAQQLKPASYYSSSDFNCYQYVRATFDGNHYGTWEPPASNNIGSSYSAAIISESNDPNDFEEVCDPADANVIVYNCGHAGVILNGECVVEKVGYGSELRKYGLNYGSCLPNSSTKFYKYIGSWWPYRGIDTDRCGYEYCAGPPEPTCNNQCVWYGTTNVLNTFNYTYNYFNQIWVDCDKADNITWQRTGGANIFFNCFSSCRGLYFYLNAGQSVTFRVTAKEGTTTLFTKDYTFYRPSGGGYPWIAEDQSGPAGNVRFAGDRIDSQTDSDLTVEVYSLLGQRLQSFPLPAFSSEFINVPQQGIYMVAVVSPDGQREGHKIFLSGQ